MMPLSDSARVWRRSSWWIATAIATRFAVGTWQLKRTLRWVDRPVAATSDAASTLDVAVHFVIPVLREQQHVSAALAWFVPLLGRLPGSTLTLVTTAREEHERERLVALLARARRSAVTGRRFPQLSATEMAELDAARMTRSDGVLTHTAAREVLDRVPLTSQVVARALARQECQGLPVRHVHYPGDGRKAAQVNYAVAHLPDDAACGYVAVYDVDSRPDVELLRRTVAFMGRRLLADGELPAVVQQSARFATCGASPRAWERMVCRGSARLQTLWTLRREIPSFRRYAWATRHATGIAVLDAGARGLAQTVGHGLLVRVDVFRRLGGLPTFTVLDDLPFGYRLTVDGVPVDCVPFTTVADAPEGVRDLLAQGQRWFQNYLDYPRCAARACAAGQGTPAARAIALGVGCYRGTTWLLRSPAVAACAVLAARRSPLPVRVVAAAALWLDVVVPVRMLAAAERRSPSIRQRGQECVELLAAYLITSVGPLIGVVRRVVGGRPGAGLAPKTDRRSTPRVAAGQGPS